MTKAPVGDRGLAVRACYLRTTAATAPKTLVGIAVEGFAVDHGGRVAHRRIRAGSR